MPAPYITISTEPSGSVSAKGASDDLSATLLKHAGFQQIEDWYGRRHRLATTTPQAQRVAIASHAAEMLRAARYSVDLDPDLDTSRLTTPANPLGLYTAGAEVLRLTDQIRAAENGAGLAQAVDHLLHPEHGVLERLREALETTGEQIADLDDEAYALADRFGFATEFVSAAQSELIEAGHELHHVGYPQQDRAEAQTQSPAPPDARNAALAASPAADKAKASPGVGTAVPPPQVPALRARELLSDVLGKDAVTDTQPSAVQNPEADRQQAARLFSPHAAIQRTAPSAGATSEPPASAPPPRSPRTR